MTKSVSTGWLRCKITFLTLEAKSMFETIQYQKQIGKKYKIPTPKHFFSAYSSKIKQKILKIIGRKNTK